MAGIADSAGSFDSPEDCAREQAAINTAIIAIDARIGGNVCVPPPAFRATNSVSVKLKKPF